MIVFLVDDDYEDHEIFKMAMERVEPMAEVHTADNGVEAVTRLEKEKLFLPDIIFMDVNMPRMNGKECVRHLRRAEHLQGIPIILYSTHDGQREIDEAREAGASDFMTKPSSIPEFAKALQAIIHTHVTSHTE